MKKRNLITSCLLILPLLAGCGGYDWKKTDSFNLHQGKQQLKVFLTASNGVNNPSVYFDCDQSLSEMQKSIKTEPTSTAYLIDDVLYLAPDSENTCYCIMNIGNRFVADSSTASLSLSTTEHYNFVVPYHLIESEDRKGSNCFFPKENTAYHCGTFTEWKQFYDLVHVDYTALEDESAILMNAYSLETSKESKNAIHISFKENAVTFSYVGK